jgi:hypothetical protein
LNTVSGRISVVRSRILVNEHGLAMISIHQSGAKMIWQMNCNAGYFTGVYVGDVDMGELLASVKFNEVCSQAPRREHAGQVYATLDQHTGQGCVVEAKASNSSWEDTGIRFATFKEAQDYVEEVRNRCRSNS